jgi:hypothetical protein
MALIATGCAADRFARGVRDYLFDRKGDDAIA